MIPFTLGRGLLFREAVESTTFSRSGRLIGWLQDVGMQPFSAHAARYNRGGRRPARIVAGSEPDVSGGFGSPDHRCTMASGAP